ncbi:MAG: succinate dehydrogenase, hydrophobic membrane anchor protein [Acidisphaera sp.]|nr:succinate dehydrogenase, hydrophobic membrane anchor protein [Acidisphaera sp.]
MSETTKGRRDLRIEMMRSQLGRVRGLGAARAGVSHWWAERVTSIALVPLTVWFILSIYRLAGLSQPDVAHWAASPLHAVLLICLILATFHHMQLGLQVVIEDYVHTEATRFSLLLAVKAASILLGLACLVSVLKLAL